MKPLAANSLLQNRYLIIHHIGKGGMGEVYLAVDQRLGNPVALKRTVFRDDAMMWDAFEREARILARLRHSVLPKVSDHFSEREEQYLVMEYISGDDLSKRLEAAKKPFPLQWVLYWADELLDALHYLHTHEPPIIHRDIKPQNLKLTNENHVVLLDFGLAKNSVAKKTHLSSSGSVVGYTPNYAPIEQIRGAGTSARSDIYSLSATLYQLMTATIPLDALTRAESVIGGTGDSLPSPREIVPGISPEISAVILRGMALNSEQRYPDAREMQKALREAYAQFQQRAEANGESFDAEETLVPEVKPAAPAMAMTSGSSEPYPLNREAGDGIAGGAGGAGIFAKAQEPPETLTAEALAGDPDFSATIPAEQWMQGETQGFSHDEIRRSTIDEDTFKTHGFDPDAEPPPMMSFDSDNGASSFASLNLESEPPPFETAARAIAQPELPEEKPVPIRPVSKPLEPKVKTAASSSGWGVKLVGIAAVLCLLTAGAGAGLWYAVTAKLINIPGLQAGRQAAAQETAPVLTEDQRPVDPAAETAAESSPDTAPNTAEKEAQSDPGTAEGSEEQSGEARSGASNASDTGSNGNIGEKKTKAAANPGQKSDKSKSAKAKNPEDRGKILQ